MKGLRFKHPTSIINRIQINQISEQFQKFYFRTYNVNWKLLFDFRCEQNKCIALSGDRFHRMSLFNNIFSNYLISTKSKVKGRMLYYTKTIDNYRKINYNCFPERKLLHAKLYKKLLPVKLKINSNK